ncbi:MAG: hypothetical protein OQL20_09535 [Sedimenticola sp.]|nr:hypothetical protein [Sedimenticola sp.]
MRSFNRLAIGLVTTVIVVVVSLFVILSSNLSALIIEKVQTEGSRIVQVPVRLQQAEMAISGEGQLKGLSVTNPEGYRNTLAIDLGTIELQLDSDTLASPVIRIKALHIMGPIVNFEQHETERSNLQQLVNNALASVEKIPTNQNGQPSAVLLIIEQLTLTDGVLNVYDQRAAAPIERPLPDLTMAAIGKEKGGSPTAEVIALVMQQVVARATEEAELALEALE